jgi:hypothetical protein
LLPLERPPWNKRFVEDEKRRIIPWNDRFIEDEMVKDMGPSSTRVFERKCKVCKKLIGKHSKEQLINCYSALYEMWA